MYPLVAALLIGAGFSVLRRIGQRRSHRLRGRSRLSSRPSQSVLSSTASAERGCSLLDVRNLPTTLRSSSFLATRSCTETPLPIVLLRALALALFGRSCGGRASDGICRAADECSRGAQRWRSASTADRFPNSHGGALVAYAAGLVVGRYVGRPERARLQFDEMIYDVLLVVVLGGIRLSSSRTDSQRSRPHAPHRDLSDGMTILNVPYVEQNLIKSVILLIAIVIDRFRKPSRRPTGSTGAGTFASDAEVVCRRESK